jgi:quinol monooxygenase YgiN
MAVKVVALVVAKPGEEEAFTAAAQTCAAASRAEPGVLHYELWRETDGERRFVFNELYVDDAAVQQHMASEQGLRPRRPRPRRRAPDHHRDPPGRPGLIVQVAGQTA